MAREFSAGGVVLHFQHAGWTVAVIEPRRDAPVDKNPPSKRNVTPILALPKGLVDPGEKAEQTVHKWIEWIGWGLLALVVLAVVYFKFLHH